MADGEKQFRSRERATHRDASHPVAAMPEVEGPRPRGPWLTKPGAAPAYPERAHPAHPPVFEAHNRAIIVFLTVCTLDRRPVLANPPVHEILRTAWAQAGHWLVGRYVIMPDHVHLFCTPRSIPPASLTSWVGYWKRLTSSSTGGRLWQKNFWDTQLRRHASYGAKWEYVRDNPVRAGLVNQADDWPYRGELNILPWHD